MWDRQRETERRGIRNEKKKVARERTVRKAATGRKGIRNERKRVPLESKNCKRREREAE